MKHSKEFKTEIHLLGPDGKHEINMGVLTLNQNTAEIQAELSYDDIFGQRTNDTSKVALSSLYGY